MLATILLIAIMNGICWTPGIMPGGFPDYYMVLTQGYGFDWETVNFTLALEDLFAQVCAPLNPPIEEWTSGNILYFVVIACNEGGCSSTGHGDFVGEGYFPEDCP